MCKRLDVTGQRYGKLLVISDAPSYVYKDGSKQRMLLCKCDCGNEVVVRLNDIRKGATKSCGCGRTKRPIHSSLKSPITPTIELNGFKKKRRRRSGSNHYLLLGDCAIGYTDKGETFCVDIEDLDVVKEYHWIKNSRGYYVAHNRNTDKTIRLHRLILNPPSDKVVDHINHDISDNRKSNLRVCTCAENAWNSKYNGYRWDNSLKKWRVVITVNGKVITVGCFLSEQEAKAARKAAEQLHWGEFAFKG